MTFKLFPIAAGTKDVPLTKWRRGGPGEQATDDPAILDAWSKRWNGCNWGAVTGSDGGFFVIDTDTFDGWLWFMSQELPATYTVKTGNPDPYRMQYYFTMPEGVRVKNSASEIAPGVDVRGEGGMVLAAPSLHPSGNRYAVVENLPIAEAPAWLIELVKYEPVERVPVEAVGELTEVQRQIGLAIFKKRLSKYAEVEDGQWNNELTKLTFLAGRMAAAGVFTEEEAEETMHANPTVEAYMQEEPRTVEANFRSGFETGAASPWDGAETEGYFLDQAGFGDAPLPPGASLEPLKRRAEQIAENIRIGDGSDEHRTVEILSVDQMIARYLYLSEVESVQDLQYPRRMFSINAFMRVHCASEMEVEVPGEWGPDGTPKKKVMPTTKVWMKSPKLLTARNVTFRPGAPMLTEDPDGNECANTWRPIVRTPALGSCEAFLHHIDYLFGADAQRFLDWLAHIEQHPGVLPHSGWVHVSPSQGTGRNWLASVLCRLWRGCVSPNFDLAGTLTSGFNGRLSHKLLAVVDEIDEGGSNAKWENAQALKSLVTTDTRAINPKYGHQRLEWNACRWLIFSNHTSALPITEADRRFNVVHNKLAPMDAGYYANLYGMLKDAGFIGAVAWMLKSRDISGFNPGAHAAMSEAKRDMIGASRSDADDIIDYLIGEHPWDVISNAKLAELLTNQQYSSLSAHHKHALDRAGTRAYGKAVKVDGKVMKVRILRNYDVWKDCPAWQIAEELKKANAPQIR